MSYSIEISHLTATSCMIYIDNDGAGGGPQNLTFYQSDGTTAAKSISVSDPGWDMSVITVSGLTPNTTYVVKLDNDTSVTATFTTLTDDPKVATESMWADLAARVKAKADSSAVPSTYWGQTAGNGAVTGDLTLATDTIHGNAEITSGATLQDGVSVSLTAGGSDIITARSYTDVRSQVSISTIELGGDIDAGSNQINNLAAGTANTDAVNKSQLDAKPTITMTSTDPGEGSALSANNYIAVYGGDPIILDYSTSEINTGAKWIDGSAIYKKTINTGALPNNGSKDALHNISNLGAVINLEGYATNGSVWLNLPAAASNPITAHATSTAIHITTTSDRSSYTESYVTIYYTKSS